jgi:uncharacterized repeat protein (TIGR03803 family)
MKRCSASGVILLRFIGIGALIAAVPCRAQILTTLVNFSGTNGVGPNALVQATDGNFYGTTQGGSSITGSVFKMTPEGTITTLYIFGGIDGSQAGLIQATDGNFYGTTAGDSEKQGLGTVFKITPGGTLTTLHSFSGGPDGSHPYARLIEGTDGTFYGTTLDGGSKGYGTVFKITPGGFLNTLHSFNGPDSAGYTELIQAADGSFYGTTAGGGPGTVFKITPGGTLTTLHNFGGSDGVLPYAGLIQASTGTFTGRRLGAAPGARVRFSKSLPEAR